MVHRFCERLERGGSFDFQRQVKCGSSYFKTGIGTYLKALFSRMEIFILLQSIAAFNLFFKLVNDTTTFIGRKNACKICRCWASCF